MMASNIRSRATGSTRGSAPGGRFDAVIDLDAAVSDPTNRQRLAAASDTGDHLHLNPAGYQKMADAIDLALFAN